MLECEWFVDCTEQETQFFSDGEDRTHLYIDTPTARLIRSRIKGATQPELVKGPPGVGKSAAIEYTVASDSRFRFVRITPARASVKAFLECVGAAFHIPVVSKSLKDSEADLLAGLRFRHGCRLIIDEAQNLQLDALRTALNLYEESGIPIVAVGNSQVLKRQRAHGAVFDQLTDRFGPPLEIKGITRGDVHAFGTAHGVEGEDAYELLIRYGLEAQSLRQVLRLLTPAGELAGEGRPIRFKHLKDALAPLCGPTAARRLIKQPQVKAA